MNKIIPPYLLRLLTKNFLIWKIKTKEKKIFLTFDDGPTPDVTDKILDILESYEVKAVFFCTGINVERFPELFSKIKNAGHQTCNHTYSHLDGWKSGAKDYVSDVERAKSIINSSLFRPPHGRITPGQIFKLRKEYYIVMWSLLAGDFYENASKERCLNNVLKHTKRGSIVVFHDSEKSADKCLYALPRFLEHFLERGFKFELLRGVQ